MYEVVTKCDKPKFYRKYEYARGGNPTRECLERCLAAVDNAEFALTFSSGLAATMTLTNLLE